MLAKSLQCISEKTLAVEYLKKGCKVPEFCQAKDCYNDCFMMEFYKRGEGDVPLCETCAAKLATSNMYALVLVQEHYGMQFIIGLCLSLGYNVSPQI